MQAAAENWVSLRKIMPAFFLSQGLNLHGESMPGLTVYAPKRFENERCKSSTGISRMLVISSAARSLNNFLGIDMHRIPGSRMPDGDVEPTPSVSSNALSIANRPLGEVGVRGIRCSHKQIPAVRKEVDAWSTLRRNKSRLR